MQNKTKQNGKKFQKDRLDTGTLAWRHEITMARATVSIPLEIVAETSQTGFSYPGLPVHSLLPVTK